MPIDSIDPIVLLESLFFGGFEPPEPFAECGDAPPEDPIDNCRVGCETVKG